VCEDWTREIGYFGCKVGNARDPQRETIGSLILDVEFLGMGTGCRACEEKRKACIQI